MSKSGRQMVRQWPELAEALRTLPRGLLLDGEIVCWLNGALSFDALLRRNRAGRDLARHLASVEPAYLVVFDLLGADGEDLRGSPLRERRARLEEVFAAEHDVHLELVWQTSDVETAREWYEGLAGVGIEGLVIKQAEGVYESDRRGWLKLRHRHTTEAIVGAVTGSVHLPRVLILGRWRPDLGKYGVVGQTSPLTAPQGQEISAWLHKAEDAHPWGPTYRPAWGADPVRYHRVRPELVVEVAPDTAVSGGRWRHPVTYVRPRPDLSPDEVPAATREHP
ncbi:ATP-dependent DNA ligase [Nocardiopsis aegyptia]|uniref:ATP-dependent DNA ligase n=1 Tax=Nocardiopsis aegyptia TaxID=220378 RepID=A0A7Z0EJM0_9ACTN|nr:ATP-dependent DNA ligase [Nocardiopsis aegyptia]NYJ32826.1 ATP-dependent DNA ligase [Nocardiopsis aegyptia]